MILKDLFENFGPVSNETSQQYGSAELQDYDSDNSVAKFQDTRKTRLTLAQINQLRKLNDVKKVEYHNSLVKIRRQYSQKADSGGGMGGMM